MSLPVVIISFAMVVGLMGTALISPLYPIYRDHWSLDVSAVSFLYVIYMIGALGSLLFLGRLADRTPHRRLIVIALLLAGGGTVLSLAAPNVAVLYGARFLVGVAASIITPACTVALMSLLRPEQRMQLPLISGLLLSLGFGIGPLLGGVMGQWAPYPLVTAYLPQLALLAVALPGVMLCTPRPARTEGRRLRVADFLPRLTAPGPGKRLLFATVCGFPFVAFGVFGVYASLAPLFIAQTLGWGGPLVSGGSITFILFASALTQLAARSVATGRLAMVGLIALGLCCLALVANMFVASAALFAAGLVLTSIGHSLLMFSGMQVVNAIATTENRAGLTSTWLAVGYAGSIAPLLLMGWISDHWGLKIGVASFCGMTATLCAILAPAFVASWSRRGA